MWLNEGFATYAEWLWQEQHGGDSAQETFDALYEGRYFAGTAENEAVWAFPPADPPDAAHLSDTPVYQRGAMVLHKLRQRIGDTAFRSLLSRLGRRPPARQREHGRLHRVRRAARPGEDLSSLWADWLYGDGRPDRP
ncbi:Aminopeptidase N OS=Streptomyces fumanus OX=67302 GN=GCM10018772_30210 PE=3 SV=1 [Streptomyces fumanus]